MSEDNAAKPTKAVKCRLFRGLFNTGWTETIGATRTICQSVDKKSCNINILWGNGGTVADRIFGLSC